MFGQLDMVRHPEVGLALLLVMAAILIADIALVALMTADGVGTALVVVFADLQAGKYLQRSLLQW